MPMSRHRDRPPRPQSGLQDSHNDWTTPTGSGHNPGAKRPQGRTRDRQRFGPVAHQAWCAPTREQKGHQKGSPAPLDPDPYRNYYTAVTRQIAFGWRIASANRSSALTRVWLAHVTLLSGLQPQSSPTGDGGCVGGTSSQVRPLSTTCSVPRPSSEHPSPASGSAGHFA
jgi:hypothetical protein